MMFAPVGGISSRRCRGLTEEVLLTLSFLQSYRCFYWVHFTEILATSHFFPIQTGSLCHRHVMESAAVDKTLATNAERRLDKITQPADSVLPVVLSKRCVGICFYRPARGCKRSRRDGNEIIPNLC